MKEFYAIQKAENTADIYIFGDIVPFEWFEGDVSAHGIVQEIKELDVKEINVHIDSFGGDVASGWGIYNALRSHPAKVNTYGDGFVASAALYPFLAGDNRFASNVSGYFLHRVIVSAQGYSDELVAAAKDAEKMTEIGINAFVERAGMDAETVMNLMKAETWLSPAQALEHGIATAIIADSSARCVQNGKKPIFEKLFNRQLTEPSIGESDGDPKPEPNEPKQKTEPKNEPNSIMQMLSGFFDAKKE